METYRQQSRVLFSIPDEPLGQIMVQYQETDWDALPYRVSRNMTPVNGEKTLKGELSYSVETYDLFSLGRKVRFRDRELYIGSIERSIRQGLLVSCYSLYFAEGLKTIPYHNPFLSGVSINGAVTAVKRDRIQARLETDALKNCQSRYFYPFSTVAASPDGSGWYCMPQKGDRVRIFFPEEDEREGYAIANIQGESAPAPDSAMGNPDEKDITTPDGKSVKFIKGGIQLSVGGEKGSVTLTNDGKAEFRTEEDIEISAAETLYFTTEGELTVIAGTEIQIVNDAGASIRMSKDMVEIQASVIRNN